MLPYARSMGYRHLRLALATLLLSNLGVVAGCSDDDVDGAPSPTAPDAEDASTSPPAAPDASTDATATATATGTGSTASLIPTDGGAYFVAAVNGTPHSFMFNVMAMRSPGGFSTARSAAGLTLPTRDLEIRFPSVLGEAACDGTVTSKAGLVLRTSDLGTLATSEDGTSCTFNVTALSTAKGERIKGTFSGTVKSDTGQTAEITEGAFDLPTIN